MKLLYLLCYLTKTIFARELENNSSEYSTYFWWSEPVSRLVAAVFLLFVSFFSGERFKNFETLILLIHGSIGLVWSAVKEYSDSNLLVFVIAMAVITFIYFFLYQFEVFVKIVASANSSYIILKILQSLFPKLLIVDNFWPYTITWFVIIVVVAIMAVFCEDIFMNVHKILVCFFFIVLFLETFLPINLSGLNIIEGGASKVASFVTAVCLLSILTVLSFLKSE